MRVATLAEMIDQDLFRLAHAINQLKESKEYPSLKKRLVTRRKGLQEARDFLKNCSIPKVCDEGWDEVNPSLLSIKCSKKYAAKLHRFPNEHWELLLGSETGDDFVLYAYIDRMPKRKAGCTIHARNYNSVHKKNVPTARGLKFDDAHSLFVTA